MTTKISHLDLECGRRIPGGAASRNDAVDDEEGGSMCFSDADEGSCKSQFYSTADGDGSYDDFSFACCSESGEISDDDDEALELRRSSEYSVNIEAGGIDETKLHMGRIERDCRICHLSLVSSSPGSGVAIELGCSCKDDLAAAHKHCAETWFKIKGNKTCEICNSIASNVVGPNDIEAAQAASESTAGSNIAATMASAPPSSSTIENPSCMNGHRFLNFLLACMVFAFVISWLFHFNIPS